MLFVRSREMRTFQRFNGFCGVSFIGATLNGFGGIWALPGHWACASYVEDSMYLIINTNSSHRLNGTRHCIQHSHATRPDHLLNPNHSTPRSCRFDTPPPPDSSHLRRPSFSASQTKQIASRPPSPSPLASSPASSLPPPYPVSAL